MLILLIYLVNTNDPRIGRLFFPGGFDPTNGYVGNVFGDPIGTLSQAARALILGRHLVANLMLMA